MALIFPNYACVRFTTLKVDEELKGQIHTEMMKAILKFEIRVK